jgi:hypothetical protein
MLVFWIAACSENGLTPISHDPPITEPDIQVEPATLDFSGLQIGCQGDATVQVTNVGASPLDVTGVFLDGLDSSIQDFSVLSLEDTLYPGDAKDVLLQFTPTAVGDVAAELDVTSDDPDEPSVVVPITGSAYDPTWQLDMFVQAPDPIDVLWVIDNSGSMWQERDRVIAALSGFFHWFEALNLDYHMGAITTDVDNPIFSGQLMGTPTFVTPQTPDPAGTLASAIDVNLLEMGPETGLAAMKLALTEPLLSGTNAGFYRPDARLVVIFLSDEPDWSVPTSADYIAFLSELKPKLDDVFVAAIVGDRDHGCNGWCDGQQTADPGDKYLDVAEAFHGFEESICTCDLAPSLERMGFESTWYTRSFDLTDAPGDPSLVQVWVDGVEATGWTYDAIRNAVVFDTAPPLGSEVVVRYPVDLTCE